MNATEQRQAPKERLEYIARVARPFHHEVFGPNYLIGAGLLLMLAALVVVGIVAGLLGVGVFERFTELILKLARGG